MAGAELEAECSEEPRKSTSGNKVILVLRFLVTSTNSIYTSVRNEWNKLGVRN